MAEIAPLAPIIGTVDAGSASHCPAAAVHAPGEVDRQHPVPTDSALGFSPAKGERQQVEEQVRPAAMDQRRGDRGQRPGDGEARQPRADPRGDEARLHRRLGHPAAQQDQDRYNQREQRQRHRGGRIAPGHGVR
jgi:hypothetical protein